MGRLTEERILLMAFCGHPGAQELAQSKKDAESWKNHHASITKPGWVHTLLFLAPGRTTPAKCNGPDGALGTAIRESTGSHPKMCVCGGLGWVDREIGGIWLGTLALVAAAGAALPLLTEDRRTWGQDDGTELAALSIKRAKCWLKNPTDRNEPTNNPCGGDWGNVIEAWGGLAPLIWERHGQEAYHLGRSMREFVKEYGEEPIRSAVEKKLIAWALEGAL